MDRNAIVAFLLKKAEAMAYDAGMSGSMGDNGAKTLRDQITCWVAGLRGETPDCWEEYIQEYNRENDPDYAEYQRLMKKFGK